jgi:hypothetical protein
MRTYGCLICSLAIITGITPNNILNELMSKRSFCFNKDGLLVDVLAAQTLKAKGWLKEGVYQQLPANTPVSAPIIAMTGDNAHLGFPTHFFVLLPDKMMIDPLDPPTPKAKPLTYNVVNQRLFA